MVDSTGSNLSTSHIYHLKCLWRISIFTVSRMSHVSILDILHFLGGPAVGDIRSRCLRLSSESWAEALAVKRLLGHRLSSEDSIAKSES
jgi:hypothetical protein